MTCVFRQKWGPIEPIWIAEMLTGIDNLLGAWLVVHITASHVCKWTPFIHQVAATPCATTKYLSHTMQRMANLTQDVHHEPASFHPQRYLPSKTHPPRTCYTSGYETKHGPSLNKYVYGINCKRSDIIRIGKVRNMIGRLTFYLCPMRNIKILAVQYRAPGFERCWLPKVA